ncbi:MAG: hypothetical protein IJ240_11000 [Clostridia bacterium]|nr:hypothetical protein [Clostridia bacterium]
MRIERKGRWLALALSALLTALPCAYADAPLPADPVQVYSTMKQAGLDRETLLAVAGEEITEDIAVPTSNGGDAVIHPDGTVDWTDESGVSHTFDRAGRLTAYTYTDSEAMEYTLSKAGTLRHMSGTIQELGEAAVHWDAAKGWYLEDGTALTAEQIAVALPYAKDARAGKISWDTQWYPNNTVGVMGLSIRDLFPDRTDKWYNVLPVDLKVQGKQIFPLVASNMFFIGKLTVDVNGDRVTVRYRLYPSQQVEVHGETSAWFTSFDDLTAEYLNDPQSNFRFGRSVSIKKDLNGQEEALLFVCNRVTYGQPYDAKGTMLTRYWPRHHRYVEYRENELMPLARRLGLQ